MKNSNSFTTQLQDYQTRINADLTSYIDDFKATAERNYGVRSREALEPYCTTLLSDSKRTRAVLTLVGYQMMGGADQDMIMQAAGALEMMHAYMKLANETNDTLTLNGALIGAHSANFILANLDVAEEYRLKVITIMNHTISVAAHGYINTEEELTPNVLQWKYAHNSVLNPLHVGMVLAGAPCEDTNAITEYALNTGKALQTKDRAYTKVALESLNTHQDRWDQQSVQFLRDFAVNL